MQHIAFVNFPFVGPEQIGMPKFSSVRFSETFLRTANLNLIVGKERAEPRTRTDRTRFGRFSSGSNRVQTLEPMWLEKKRDPPYEQWLVGMGVGSVLFLIIVGGRGC
jgi:hypothetical protein